MHGVPFDSAWNPHFMVLRLQTDSWQFGAGIRLQSIPHGKLLPVLDEAVALVEEVAVVVLVVDVLSAPPVPPDPPLPEVVVVPPDPPLPAVVVVPPEPVAVPLLEGEFEAHAAPNRRDADRVSAVGTVIRLIAS